MLILEEHCFFLSGPTLGCFLALSRISDSLSIVFGGSLMRLPSGFCDTMT